MLSLPTLCLLLFLAARPATTAEQHTAPVTDQASGADGQSSVDEKPNRQSKRRAVTVAVYLLAGIAFAGLALVATVALLGHHVRRIVRKPRPRQTHTDEFWYLRPKKEIGTKQKPEPPGSDENDEDTQTP